MSVKEAAELECSIINTVGTLFKDGKGAEAVSVMLDYVAAGFCIDMLEDLEDLKADEKGTNAENSAAAINPDAKVELTARELRETYGDGWEKVPRP
jgi:hypothetical protein